MNWLDESVKRSKKLKDHYMLKDVDIYIKDPVTNDVDIDFVIRYVAKRLPNHVLSNIDIIYVGYCSNLSKKQIKNINTNIYKTHLEIFFLDEVFNVRVFHFILFFLKRLKRKFLICVSGTYDYYLFKEFIKKSEKVVLLDEGISLLSTRNHEALKKYNTTL